MRNILLCSFFLPLITVWLWLFGVLPFSFFLGNLIGSFIAFGLLTWIWMRKGLL